MATIANPGPYTAEIATEKAGIIKENRIVVTSAQSPEALLAIAEVSRARYARMVRMALQQMMRHRPMWMQVSCRP